jgi:type II secretory pathway pseudopilin PulG
MITSTKQRQAGFTLVELSVTVALLMIVLVPILMSLRSSESSTGDIRKSTEARAQARAAIDLLTRDLRQAQTEDPTLMAVTEISASKITFHSPDKSTPYRLRKITYQLSGSTLTRSVAVGTYTGSSWTFPTAPAATVIENVKPGSTFAAKNRAGAATTAPADVRIVDVTVIVNGIPRPGAAQTFRQTVELRAAV